MIELCLCIAKGIEKIHQVGIAHRDLKSKNVLLFFNNSYHKSFEKKKMKIDFD